MPDTLRRIAEALERLAPPPVPVPDFSDAGAYVWHPDPDRLEPVEIVNRVDLVQLIGIDRSKDTLLANTLQFARGHAANNALLWGARGMGKSSLVKAVHAEAVAQGLPLVLVELEEGVRTAVPHVVADGPDDVEDRLDVMTAARHRGAQGRGRQRGATKVGRAQHGRESREGGAG